MLTVSSKTLYAKRSISVLNKNVPYKHGICTSANNKRNAALNSNAFGYCCNNCHTQSKNCKNIGLRSTDFEFPSPCPHQSWNL